MNERLSRKLEVSANISVVVIAFLILGVVAFRFATATISTKAPIPKQDSIVGSVIEFDGVDLTGSDKNLVFAISTKCRFCTESIPFYRTLLERRAKNDSVRFIAVLPQPVEEAKVFFDSKKLYFDSVNNGRLDSISVVGTPTLLLIDNKGTVINSWVGKLTPEREADVFRMVFGGQQ